MELSNYESRLAAVERKVRELNGSLGNLRFSARETLQVQRQMLDRILAALNLPPEEPPEP